MDKNQNETKAVFNWTWNPFVDTGLTVMLYFAKKDNISDLNYECAK